MRRRPAAPSRDDTAGRLVYGLPAIAPGRNAGHFSLSSPAKRARPGQAGSPKPRRPSRVVQAASSKPGRPKPGRPKPGRPKPSRAKPDRTKPSQAKPSQAKPGRPQPDRAADAPGGVGQKTGRLIVRTLPPAAPPPANASCAQWPRKARRPSTRPPPTAITKQTNNRRPARERAFLLGRASEQANEPPGASGTSPGPAGLSSPERRKARPSSGRAP
jgi:hypothetical protein